MFINPTFIAANGDTAIVSVLVIEPAGTPVPDGTVVQFFTTLGRIQEQGKTNDGVARVNLISDARSGTAMVTAVSGGVAATGTGSGGTGSGGTPTTSGEVKIGSARPARIVPGVIDSRIELKSGRTIARFKVTVLDEFGNPVSGVPVRFTSADPALDTVHGSDTTTDNNGDAFSQVQTRRTAAGTITVKAEALVGAVAGLFTDITISVVE